MKLTEIRQIMKYKQANAEDFRDRLLMEQGPLDEKEINYAYMEVNKYNHRLPRSMIPEAVFREFPRKTLRKRPVSGQNLPENAKNSSQEIR